MYLEKNDFILFTGDSITDAGRKRPIGEGLWEGVGNGFVRQVDNLVNAFYPELNIRIANTGISGNTSRDLAGRWQSDALDLKPDVTVLCIGVNDVWRQFDEPTLTYSHVQPEEYEINLRRMLSSGKEAFPKGMILLTPYYMEPLKEDMMRKRMDEYGAICKKAAAEFGFPCIDLQAIFDEYFTKRHSCYITWDRVHPSGPACMLMAKAVFEKLGFSLCLEQVR